MTANEQVVSALRKAAQDLIDRRSLRDIDATLGAIVAAAVDTIPGADAGSVSLTESGHVSSRNPTREDIDKLDQRQTELGEGPCITAATDPPPDGVVVARDLAGDDAERWPRFAPAATEFGYRSLLSTQLSARPRVWAALNLYAAHPDVFDDDARMTAALFGSQAATLLYGSDEAVHLGRALESRDLIGRAKGILAERLTVSDDEAFEMLVRSSQDTNMKLTAVARWLTSEADERRSQRGPARTER